MSCFARTCHILEVKHVATGSSRKLKKHPFLRSFKFHEVFLPICLSFLSLSLFTCTRTRTLSHTVALAEACYLQFSLERVIPAPLWQLGACDHRKLKGSSCSLLSPVLACADWVHRGQVIQTGASAPPPHCCLTGRPLGERFGQDLVESSFFCSGIMTFWPEVSGSCKLSR